MEESSLHWSDIDIIEEYPGRDIRSCYKEDDWIGSNNTHLLPIQRHVVVRNTLEYCQGSASISFRAFDKRKRSSSDEVRGLISKNGEAHAGIIQMYPGRLPCSGCLLCSPADASLRPEDDSLTETRLHDFIRENFSEGANRSYRGKTD